MKLQAFRLIKSRLQHRCFPVNMTKFYEHLFQEHLRKAAFVSLLIFLTTFNLFQPTAAFHIVTSHLVCTANQLAGFCVKCKSGLKWICAKHVVKEFRLIRSQDFLYSMVKKWKCCCFMFDMSLLFCFFLV